jgi:hypothetical protein
MGDHELLVEIVCYGQLMHVTPNLCSALQRLRYAKEPRKVCINTICINYIDLEEHFQQVSFMRDIYIVGRKSVVVWPGEDDGTASTATPIIHISHSQVQSLTI